MTDSPPAGLTRPRYFVFVAGHPFERTEHEVRLTTQDGDEGRAYTVVKPDEVTGYVIHVGGPYPPNEWELDRLRGLLDRAPAQEGRAEVDAKLLDDLRDARAAFTKDCNYESILVERGEGGSRIAVGQFQRYMNALDRAISLLQGPATEQDRLSRTGSCEASPRVPNVIGNSVGSSQHGEHAKGEQVAGTPSSLQGPAGGGECQLTRDERNWVERARLDSSQSVPLTPALSIREIDAIRRGADELRSAYERYLAASDKDAATILDGLADRAAQGEGG